MKIVGFLKTDFITDERGVSLLEMLGLVVTVGIAITLSMTLMKDWAVIAKAEKTSDYMQVVMEASGDMAKNYTRFQRLFDVIEANGGALEIPILDPGGAPFSVENGDAGPDPAWFGSPLIDAGFSPRNPLGSTMSMYAATETFASGRRAIHLLLMAKERAPDEMVRQAAEMFGGQGGMISALELVPGACGGPCANVIRGVYGDWVLNTSLFAPAGLDTLVSSAPPNLAEGSYLAAYSYILEEIVYGDYVHRFPRPENPSLNRLHNSLDMGGRNILGADNIFTNSARYTDYISVYGDAYLEGEFKTTEMIVNEDLGVDELVFHPLFLDDPKITYMAERNFYVEGATNAGSVTCVTGCP